MLPRFLATRSPGPEPPHPMPEPSGPFPLEGQLDRPASYDQIFRVVRAAVVHALHRERPGLGLGLARLSPSLGAFWQVTGNLIVMNESLVDAMRAMAKSPREFNSFVYVTLAHEYLHALGYLDEREVRSVTAYVTRRAFGADHPATKMAEGNLWELYPFLQYATHGGGESGLRIVPRFDLETTQSYIR